GSIVSSPQLVQPAQAWPEPPNVEAAVREANARDFPYSSMLGKLRISPGAWDKMVSEWPPASKIEDRRGELQPDVSPEELAAGIARWNAIRDGYLKDYKANPERYNTEEQKYIEYLARQRNPSANYRKEYK